MTSGPLVFLSYHFSPSNEIGARRPTAFVRQMAADGLNVAVVSAFGSLRNTLPGDLTVLITPIRIAEPNKWVLKALVRIKKRIAGLLHPRTKVNLEADGSPGTTIAESEVPEFKSFLAVALVDVATVVDTDKLWSWRAAQAARAAIGQNGACGIVASGPPMSNLLAAVWVSWRCKIPLIADFRDPWVVGRLPAQRWNAFDLWLSRKLEAVVLRQAQLITVTTSTLADALTASFPGIAGKIHVVRNGFDGELRPALHSTANRLNVLFAGEIYGNRNPFEFFDALERLLTLPGTDASRVSVTFVGRCEAYQGQSLKTWMRGRKCEAVVRILPPVHLSELTAMIEQSTVLLNLANNEPHAVPAKSYDHMASGREVLILCEAGSATARLFDNIDGVNLVDPSDAHALDSVMKDIYRRHVEEGVPIVPTERAALAFSRRRQSEHFLRLVRAVTSSVRQ